jgi:epoxyqueuosine reductase QueG
MSVKAEINSETVKEYGFSAGASVVGIAAAKDFGSAPEGFRPSDNLEGCLSVIVLGITFPQDVLNDTAEYTACRNAMLNRMTDMAKELNTF